MGLQHLPWPELALLGVGLIALTILAIATWRRAVSVRIAVAVGLLAIGAGLLGTWLLGKWPFVFNPFHDTRHVLFLLTVTLVTAAALPFRFVWARWIALGLGVGGLLSGGLNAINVLSHWHAPLSTRQAPFTWLYLIGCGWAGAIALSLAGRQLREAFLERHDPTGLWASQHRVVRMVRWTILGNLVAAPMLLVFAWSQPVVPQTVDTALWLAGLLILGTMLAMARKVAGALLLTVAGLGLFAQTAATYLLATPAWKSVTLYYAVFWLPGAALSLACAVVLAAPLWRLLRR
jgi:hypothetical protein